MIMLCSCPFCARSDVINDYCSERMYALSIGAMKVFDVVSFEEKACSHDDGVVGMQTLHWLAFRLPPLQGSSSALFALADLGSRQHD